MKFVDEFRDVAHAQALAEEIRRTATRRWTVMEVCGGQTHSLLRHGIDAAVADAVELIHGPGCPVCVTPAEAIDFAIELAARPGVMLTSFGDMLRVPGTRGSLLQARAAGADVRMVYSPLDAVALAQRHPNRQVVFFAVGFETTAPATALAVRRADAIGLGNFSVLVAHVRVQPAMELLASDADSRVQGFLAAGHVCAVLGYDGYVPFVERFGLPVVVAGFEPIDLLIALRECVRQLEAGRGEVANCYGRGVRPAGNSQARTLVETVYEPCDRDWRGIGRVPGGGLRFRPAWERFDARKRFSISLPSIAEAVWCRGGEVLTGRLKPIDCPHFGRGCTPETPLGAPMVSSEGACAAYHRYASSYSTAPVSPV
jgi:hydrogenase expression/formation protein HypD